MLSNAAHTRTQPEVLKCRQEVNGLPSEWLANSLVPLVQTSSKEHTFQLFSTSHAKKAF